MINAEMRDVAVVGWLIRHTGTIPVDRTVGAYAAAVESLRRGELVGVYPEATISRSFQLKEFKSGAVRMAKEALVPIVPLIVWGAQRLWTKDHPKPMGRYKFPVAVAVGRPIRPDTDVLDASLRAEMTQLLHDVQAEYAPTPAEARLIEEAELAERARRRAEGGT